MQYDDLPSGTQVLLSRLRASLKNHNPYWVHSVPTRDQPVIVSVHEFVGMQPIRLGDGYSD